MTFILILALHLWLAPSLFLAGVVYAEWKRGSEFDALRTLFHVAVWPIALGRHAAKLIRQKGK